MHTTITTDAYVRTVKGLSVIDSRTFELQIDLGFGIIHRHTVRLAAPLLDVGDGPTIAILREIFGQDPLVVTVATEKPHPLNVPTGARIYVNGEPLELAVMRAHAQQTGEVAL